MANVLSLAMKVTGDASGLIKPMTQAEKALAGLGSAADRSLQALDKFASGSSAAAAAQARAAGDFGKLAEALQAGLDPQEYARQFAALQASTKDLAAAFEEGARVTEQAKTEDEKRADQMERLNRLLDVGAISEETHARQIAEASGANEAAARSEKERADAAAAAARIIQANLTPQEKYDNQLQELSQHLREGRLSQEQFNRASDKAAQELKKAGAEAGNTDKQLQSLNKNVALLKNIEIGRLLIDGLQLVGGAIRSVTSQITGLVGNVNSSLATLSDLAARTGIGVESFQKYSIAAKLAGVDTEQFGTAVQKLTVNIGKAAPGDALDKSLRNINLSVVELRQLSPEQQFSAIGEAISTLPTAADRAAASVEIFGKQGAALAPLFREGAASIEELQARAERLGIIVSETQVNNVADMNDAFDLVSETINGIIGQVIGNLAPAVTDVTEQFLKFVEEWSGAQGTGGTGIANAITDVLLRGAEYFATVFDDFVKNFGGFSQVIEGAASTFQTVSNILSAVSGALTAAFNVFELAGNALSAALGKLLESVGSFIDSDLEQYGRDLQAAAAAAGQENSRQLEEAATKVGQAVTNVLTGDAGSAQQSGQGTAQQYLSGLRQEIERQRLPEVKLQADLDSATEDLGAFLNTAESGTSAFLKESQATLATFSQMASEGQLTATQIEVMNGFMEKLNGELTKEKQLRQQATEEAVKQAEADKKRVEDVIKAQTELSKPEQDILAVQREILLVQKQQYEARKADDSEAASAATARLAQLDQVLAKLEDQQQAVDQGFTEGFDKAFVKQSEAITDALDKTKQFGAAGVQASQVFADGLAKAAQQVRDGVLNKEAYENEFARQRALFDEQVKRLEELRAREEENRRRVFDAQIAANERVNQLLRDNIDQRTKAEIAAADAVTARKTQALENVAALQQRITLAEKSVEAARGIKDLAAAKARTAELNLLKKTQKAEQDIADGKIQAAKQQQLAQAQGIDGGFSRFEQFQSLVSQQNTNFANAIQNSYSAANAALSTVAEANARQERFLEQLNTLGSRTVQASDIRTQEGASLVLGLAANAQDPQLIEAKIQTKLQRQLVQGISQTLNRVGLPAYIPV
jgi:hypothetical protein